ncbi:MAG: hypothetical protein GY769_26050 [bacterium]|nr:hypothetical protein [bacterium]
MKSFHPSRLFVVAWLSLLVAPPAVAQKPAASLRAELEIEERLLERARDQYREARSAERDAVREYEELGSRQDALLDRVLQRTLAGEQVGISASGETLPRAEPSLMLPLRAGERELAGARETALALARDSAHLRRDLIARATRIDELRSAIAKLDRAGLVSDNGLDGRWRIELAGAGITGLVDFDSEGTLVTGSYRLTNGSQGSIRGTLSNNRLELERIDWRTGFDTTLRGELDAAAGSIHGTWTAIDVSGGAPSSGDWTANRVPRGSLSRE